jgi:hypothetical protein
MSKTIEKAGDLRGVLFATSTTRSMTLKKLPVVLGFVGVFALASSAWATPVTTVVNVSMDTTPLQSIGGSWSLDFDLIEADSASDNKVDITNLSLGTGGVHTGPDTFIGAGSSGGFPAYSLQDSQHNDEVIVQFTAGDTVQFQLDYTNNFSGSGTPDTFTWAVLDSTGVNSIVTSPLFGASLTILLDGTTNPDGTGGSISTAAADATLYNSIQPTVSPVTTGTVPEPMSGLLVITGLAFARRRFKRAATR